MIETEISITVNRKPDINLIEQKIIENKFQFPIYIREYEFSYQINFTSDYEEWELIQQFSIVSQDMNLLKTLKKGEKK